MIGESQIFPDRSAAGERLAGLLSREIQPDALLLGLPRGGVIVAGAVGKVLGIPVDVYVVRKLRAPINPELAIGAVAEDGAAYLDRSIIRTLGVTDDYIDSEVDFQKEEISRQVELYRGHPIPALTGKDAVIVDDGIATGATVRAALAGVRTRRPSRAIVAAPVCSGKSMELLSLEADAIICVQSPEDFWAVGQFYRRFDQVGDDEVVAVLQSAET